MSCLDVISNFGWDCAPIGKNAFLAYAPLTLGNDGQTAKFYVLNDTPDTFFLTDDYAAVEHAVDHGAFITDARIKSASNVLGLTFAQVKKDGEIVAAGSLDDLSLSLWDALRATMAITSKEKDWQPKHNQTRFTKIVGKSLKQKLKGRLIDKPKIKGASGHQLEFPFGVSTISGHLRVIQPIAIDNNNKFDWGLIYQSFGKLSDVKKVSENYNGGRLVVIEEGSDKNDFSRAATILSDVAQIVVFSETPSFFDLIAA